MPATPNSIRSVDIMADALWHGRRFRIFNGLDDLNREALRIETDTSLPARRIVQAITELRSAADPPRRAWTSAPNSSTANSWPRRVIMPQTALHSGRQAEPERLYRALQADLPGRGPRRLRLRDPLQGPLRLNASQIAGRVRGPFDLSTKSQELHGHGPLQFRRVPWFLWVRAM